MDLLSCYANSIGVKIPAIPVKPFSKFFPTPEKFITIQNSSGLPSKTYSHFQQVIDLIKPILDEYNIKIVQIGGETDTPLAGTRPYHGKCDLHQTSYIVKNALLHVGNDSCWVHAAGQYNVPYVSLYGPTIKNVCESYYRHPDSIGLESHRNGKIASHIADEKPKTIDFINPEEVAAAVLKVLNINETLNFKTLFIGEKYYAEQIHLVPENISYPKFNKPLIVRMDLIHDNYALARILSSNAAEIKTKQPIPKEILQGFKDKILSVIYEIDKVEDCDIPFVENLNHGIRYVVVSKAQGDELGAIKLKLFDYCVVSEERKFEKWENGEYKKGVRAKTKVKLFFGDKFYASDYHFKRNIPMENDTFRLEEKISNPDFDNFIPNLYIYEII